MRYLFAFLTVGLVWAGEQVLLQSGFTISVERHTFEGDIVKLHTKNGVIEIPRLSIVSIEAEEYVPEAPGAPQAEPMTAAKSLEPKALTPRQMVDHAAAKYGLPPEILHSVARVESAYRTDAVSTKGAIGVMQLMPATAERLNADPRDPAQNIDAGARHLRDLLVQYQGSTVKALAAYNAGEGAVSRYGGVPPYSETQNYVQKVLRNYWKLAGEPANKQP